MSAAGKVLLVLLLTVPSQAQKFYPDDPIWKEPGPVSLKEAKARKLSEYYDFFHSTFFRPGETHPKDGFIPSLAVNTLGEVPDSGWYVNRHGQSRMSLEKLVRGPGNEHPPSLQGPWKVVAAKSEGVTPGFLVEDAEGRRYVVKFDPVTNPEMASAADVIVAKFFHALGYYVPENYIAYFQREQLVVLPDTRITDASGKHRKMTNRDIDDLLLLVPYDEEKGYRALASRFISGKILGPFRYYGTRHDDPNDIVPHEHRRDLRGLFVSAAWLGHNDIKSLNTLDTLVEEDGVRFIKHYLIDFGASLGSDSFTAKSPRAGYQYLFAWKPSVLQMFTLGFLVPYWAKAEYPDLPSVGRFESKIFDPDRWKPNYPIPSFENRLPDDTFWAAKQVMAFTNEETRAVVETGELSDPEAVDWLTRSLIERRDKIGRTYFSRVLPLDLFAVKDGKLDFADLAVEHGFSAPRSYNVRWFRFDNATEKSSDLAGETSFALPEEVRQAASGEYYGAEIVGDDPNKRVSVYVRKESAGVRVVGIGRTW